MTPAVSPGIRIAHDRFNDPAVRADVLAWHQEGVSLLDMSDRLQLPFEPALRDAIANLTPKEVETIRTAMIAAINAAADQQDTKMPVDCDLVALPKAIKVEPTTVAGAPWARVVEA